MAFIKGSSGNPNGKIPGTPNKKTTEHLDRTKAMLEAIEADCDLPTLISSLSPKEKASLYLSLLEFTQPRLARSEHTDGNGGPTVITVLHSPSPIALPTAAFIEDADYTKLKTLPEGKNKPF